MTWYWLDTEWACGAVVANSAGVIVDSAPIFRKLRGQHVDRLPHWYKREALR